MKIFFIALLLSALYEVLNAETEVSLAPTQGEKWLVPPSVAKQEEWARKVGVKRGTQYESIQTPLQPKKFEMTKEYLGTVEEDVPYYGNCFYHVFAYFLLGDENLYRELVLYVIAHAKEYEHIFENSTYKTSANYIKETKLEDDSNSPLTPEFYYLIVEMFQVHIYLFQTIQHKDPNAPMWVHLRHTKTTGDRPTAEHPTIAMRVVDGHTRIIKDIYKHPDIKVDADWLLFTAHFIVKFKEGGVEREKTFGTRFNTCKADLKTLQHFLCKIALTKSEWTPAIFNNEKR
ncbi:hypothetical protein DdX_20300 [Ditylenchus destructor]|uniref:Uncharacterized protein n=1 Tax=Ditylenchus destructor TaxID=166010 RepID=A0AAD4QWN4_9BILA|nr:hypothetical protein DdX_20300 [Ditylenchus destructor]